MMSRDVNIVYKSMGIWTELDVVTQTFTNDARAYFIARPTPPEDRPKGLDTDDRRPIEILLNRADMRRLALHLLVESMG